MPDDPTSTPMLVPTATHGLNAKETIVHRQPHVSFVDVFVSTQTSGMAQVFEAAQDLDEYIAINELPGFENFAGWIRYDLNASLTKLHASRPARIRVKGLHEGVHVIVNGQDLGLYSTVASVVDVINTLVMGTNAFTLICDTTLVLRLDDFLSAFVAQAPLGITDGTTLELC